MFRTRTKPFQTALLTAGLLTVLANTLLLPGFAQNRHTLVTFYKVTREDQLVKALAMLNDTSAEDSLDLIVNKPIRIIFKRLKDVDKRLKDYDAISYLGFNYVGLDRVLLGSGYDVAADFEDSGGIFVNAEVTYRGVGVGRVSDMELVEELTKRETEALDRKHARSLSYREEAKAHLPGGVSSSWQSWPPVSAGISRRTVALVGGLGLLTMAVLAPFAYFGVLQTLIVPGDACFFTMELVRGGDFLSYVRPAGTLNVSRLRLALRGRHPRPSAAPVPVPPPLWHRRPRPRRTCTRAIAPKPAPTRPSKGENRQRMSAGVVRGLEWSLRTVSVVLAWLAMSRPSGSCVRSVRLLFASTTAVGSAQAGC